MFWRVFMSWVLIVIVCDRMKKMAERDTCETHTPRFFFLWGSALAHRAMADAATAQHDDTNVGEPSLGTIDDTMADDADAAAAAALVALPQPNPAAAGTFSDGM
jgi:hypothetical protein